HSSPNFCPRFWVPHPSGWAEERRQKRIRACDCLSAASSSKTPLLSSTAGCPQRSGGSQTIGSPFFWVLFFGEAKTKCLARRGETRLVGKPQIWRSRRLRQAQ